MLIIMIMHNASRTSYSAEPQHVSFVHSTAQCSSCSSTKAAAQRRGEHRAHMRNQPASAGSEPSMTARERACLLRAEAQKPLTRSEAHGSARLQGLFALQLAAMCVSCCCMVRPEAGGGYIYICSRCKHQLSDDAPSGWRNSAL